MTTHTPEQGSAARVASPVTAAQWASQAREARDQQTHAKYSIDALYLFRAPAGDPWYSDYRSAMAAADQHKADLSAAYAARCEEAARQAIDAQTSTAVAS